MKAQTVKGGLAQRPLVRKATPLGTGKGTQFEEPARRFTGNAAILLGIVVLLNLIGLLMVLSASSVHALQEYGSSWVFFKRQVLWVLTGGGGLLLAARVDYRRWSRLAIPMLVVTGLLLVPVLVTGL